jgi:hypothetical protein
MFPLPILMWVKIGAVIAALGFAYYKGYSGEHDKFVAFQAQVEAQGKIQEAKNESIVKQQDLVSKGIKNDYESKLAAVRNYYGGLQHSSTSGSKLPSLSNPSGGANESASYYQLAESCSETTIQTLALQEWILQQAGIK